MSSTKGEREERELPKCRFCGSDAMAVQDLGDFETAPMGKYGCGAGVGVCSVHPETGWFYTDDEAKMAWRLLMTGLRLYEDER